LSIYLIFGIYLIIEFIKPFKAERHFRDGYNLLALKRYSYAIEELKLATKYAPWETHYKVHLAKAYEESTLRIQDTPTKILQFNNAINQYEVSIKLDDLNPWYRNRLATAYEKLIKLEPEKKETYEALIFQNKKIASELDTQNPLFQINYAYYLHQNNQIEEAIKYYEKTVAYDGRIIEARLNLANIYTYLNKPEKTLKQLIGVHKQNKNYKNINLMISNIYITSKNFEAALPYLEDHVVNFPKDKQTLLNLSGICFRLNKWEKAALHYKNLFKFFPEESKNNHQFLIQSLVNSGKVETALA
jgi:predicted Zn-dependent protease